MSAPPPFDQLRAIFEPDDDSPSLCDIIAPDARLAAWAAFLEEVVPAFPHHYVPPGAPDDAPHPLPADKEALLRSIDLDTGDIPTLNLDLRGLYLRVYFYSPDNLEIDFWRTDVDAPRYQLITDLMRRMGRAMTCDVFLTVEMNPQECHFVYDGAADAFRTPRHDPSDANRAPILAELREIIRPWKQRRDTSTDDACATIVTRLDALTASRRALALQDALTSDEYRALISIRSSAHSLAEDLANSKPPPRRHIVREILDREVATLWSAK